MTVDGELIIHHDPKEKVNNLDNNNPYVEAWTLDDLRDFGFCSFYEMISNKNILSNWQDKGKMVCLELKRRPHPKSPLGGGYLGGRGITNQLSKMIQRHQIFSLNSRFQNQMLCSMHFIIKCISL